VRVKTSRRDVRDCPCFSGLRYAACCAPLHSGEREASTPEALMRSRYAAFALGLGEYLVRTLSADHPDRALDAATLVRNLSLSVLTHPGGISRTFSAGRDA
jgi:SEC-C motif-containing protein